MSDSKKINWWEPVIGKKEADNILAVLESGFINDGPVSRRFEKAIAEICDTKYAVVVTSGTTALYLALLACGVGPGDEVIVPDLTFIATANAVSMTGAKVVLVDIEASTLGLDPYLFEQAITTKTKAVIPVHISGRAADLSEILKVAKRYNLMVVEDAAEALGFTLNDVALGSIGDLGCFSFSPNKTITTGQGGMIITASRQLYEKIIMLKDQGRPIRGTGGPDVHQSIGYNFKFTDIQAAMGIAQVESLCERTEKLKRIYELYSSNLLHLKLLTFPSYSPGTTLQWVDLIVEKGRDDLCEYLKKNNVDTRKFWLPLHTQEPYRKSDECFRVAQSISDKAFWLPSSLELSDDDVLSVCRMINAWHELQSKAEDVA